MLRYGYRRGMDDEEGVRTGMPDLSGVPLHKLLEEPPPGLEKVIGEMERRIRQPGTSISGYNPQRLT